MATKRCAHALAIVSGMLLSLAITPKADADAPEGFPDAIELTGTVRDFRRAHPDFNVVPDGGPGHYAGNIALGLGTGERPVFIGGGFRVLSEWRDSGGQPIAPHLYAGSAGSGVIPVAEPPILINNYVLDTFDSSDGPYGGANVGPAPTFDIGAPMPVLSEPTGLGPNIGEYAYDSPGVTVLNSDLHCDKFLIRNGHEILIRGNITVLVEEEFKVQNHAKIKLTTGSSLVLYVKKNATVQDYAEVNYETADPSRLTIFNLGNLPFNLQNESHLYGQLKSPDAELLVQNNAHFYGRFIGRQLHVKNQAGFHLDTGPDVCGNPIADFAGAAAGTDNGGIMNDASFDQWYRDTLGTNFSVPHKITLLRNEAGVYEFLDDAFYPIDDWVLGNEGELHNNHFTYAISAMFLYESCTGQFVEFQGSDDAWLFVNESLAIDLGGVLPDTEQIIEMDRLGLEDGSVYEVHLFCAQRRPTESIFRMRTNIPFWQETTNVLSTSPFD